VFGLATPCRHSLPGALHAAWTAHLCGLCLTLRDRHGQPARAATNVDAVLVSVLVAAQRSELAPTRTAGACALRGLRRAEVVRADAPASRLAAGVSLLLAGAVVADHVGDADLPRLARPAAARLARRWERRGAAELAGLGLAAGPLAGVAERASTVEHASGAADGVPAGLAGLFTAIAPAEEATAAAFARTAVIAGRPGNIATLAEAGRLVGRIAHLTDALVDQDDDDRRGRWNPLTATGTPPAVAVGAVEDALSGLRAAVGRLDLPGRAPRAAPESARQAELARRLLTRVLPGSVRRLLGRSGHRVLRCGHRSDAPGDLGGPAGAAGDDATGSSLLPGVVRPLELLPAPRRRAASAPLAEAEEPGPPAWGSPQPGEFPEGGEPDGEPPADPRPPRKGPGDRSATPSSAASTGWCDPGCCDLGCGSARCCGGGPSGGSGTCCGDGCCGDGCCGDGCCGDGCCGDGCGCDC